MLPCMQSRMADLVCAEYGTPRIAICVAGTSDELARNSTQNAVRSQLLDAIGGNQVTIAVVVNDSSGAEPHDIRTFGLTHAVNVGSNFCATSACADAVRTLEQRDRVSFGMTVYANASVPLKMPARPYCFVEGMAWKAPAGVELLQWTRLANDRGANETSWTRPRTKEEQGRCTSAALAKEVPRRFGSSLGTASFGGAADGAAAEGGAVEGGAATCASPPPRLALCLTGHARTLPSPLSYRTLAGNLIAAFGAATTIFAHIKLGDAQSGVHWPLPKGSSNSKKPEVHTTAADVWSTLSWLGVRPKHARLVKASAAASYPSCNVTYRFSPQFASLRFETYATIMGQLENRKACYDLIVQAEEAEGGRFDHVFITRPDLIWPVATAPHCQWNLSKVLLRADYMMSMPRTMLQRALLDTHTRYHTCQQLWRDGHSVPMDARIRMAEDYFHENLNYVGVEWERLALPNMILRPGLETASASHRGAKSTPTDPPGVSAGPATASGPIVFPGDNCAKDFEDFTTYAHHPFTAGARRTSSSQARHAWKPLCYQLTVRHRCASPLPSAVRVALSAIPMAAASATPQRVPSHVPPADSSSSAVAPSAVLAAPRALAASAKVAIPAVGGWLGVAPPWPGLPYSIWCPDSAARCRRLNVSSEAIRTSCFEPEVETFEVISSLLLHCGQRGSRGREGACAYVDIGCNMGFFAAHAARLGARVRCYEPQDWLTGALRATASTFADFEVHQAAVVPSVPSSPSEESHLELRRNEGYRPCDIGTIGVGTVRVPKVAIQSALAEMGGPTTLLKIDIDSIEGALLHTVTNLVARGEARVDSILVELGCNRFRTQLDPAPRDRPGCHWAGELRQGTGAHLPPSNQRHPRGGDVHDLWRLQQLGYDVYRVNIHVNREVYDWRGVDVNKQPTAAHPAYEPLFSVRAMRKLELLRRHNDSSGYAALIARAQSFLITRVPLAEVRRAQSKDLFFAGIKEGLAALNLHNPALTV